MFLLPGQKNAFPVSRRDSAGRGVGDERQAPLGPRRRLQAGRRRLWGARELPETQMRRTFANPPPPVLRHPLSLLSDRETEERQERKTCDLQTSLYLTCTPHRDHGGDLPVFLRWELSLQRISRRKWGGRPERSFAHSLSAPLRAPHCVWGERRVTRSWSQVMVTTSVHCSAGRSPAGDASAFLLALPSVGP